MSRIKLKHPDGKFVHRNEEGEFVLQNGEDTAVELTIADFRKSSKYVKAEKTYKKGNLKYQGGTINKWIWNGGTELEAICPAVENINQESPEPLISNISEDHRTLEEKVLDWAFKGDEFNHNNGEVESSGELLFIEAIKEGENPFLIAARLESKRMIRMRIYEPNQLATDVKEMIRSGFTPSGWRGVSL